jgi:ureidoacrylate peracid hydrolase
MHRIEIPDYVIAGVMARRGRVHLYDRLEAARTALLVVDLQNAFMLPGMPAEVPAAREIVPNVNRLARATRAAGGTVVWIKMTSEPSIDAWGPYRDIMSPERRAAMHQRLARGDHGHDLHAGLEAQPGDLTVEKTRFSAFIQGSSDLDRLLHARGIDTVVVTGTLTNVCCESTARDAMMLNYRIVFVADANATRTDAEHNATLASILQVFGDVRTTEEVVARLAPASRDQGAAAS